MIFVFIPLVLWDQSFTASKFKFIFELGGNEQTVLLFQWIAALTIIIAVILIFSLYIKDEYRYLDVKNIFILCVGSYTLLSFLLTGITVHPIEQYLYLVNIAVILLVASRLQGEYSIKVDRPAFWVTTALSVVVILALLSMLALQLNVKPMEDVGRF